MIIRVFAVIGVALFFVLTRWLFWVGYAGADDFDYGAYAWHFDHLPTNWWEARMLFVLSMRASYFLLGPTEFAATFSTLLSSILLICAVAWFVDWPRTLNWQTTSAVLFANVLWISTTPSANVMSASLLALGTVAFLHSSRWVQLFGVLSLGLGFSVHALSFFYVGFFCLICLVWDFHRFALPVLCCVVFSGILAGVEMVVYSLWAGEPLLRWKIASGAVGLSERLLQIRHGGSYLRFYLWPLQFLLFSKAFGFDLIILLVGGILVWKHLEPRERIVFTTMFVYWFWLSYGTQVPWAYRPRSRAYHYYIIYVFSVSALLPRVLGLFFRTNEKIAKIIVALLLASHLLMSSAGGSWGQRVEVSMDLRRYAQAHPEQWFLADVWTWNEMYIAGNFQVPENVGVLPESVGRLKVPRQKQLKLKERFTEKTIDAILINKERDENPPLKPYQKYLKVQRGEQIATTPVSYRLIFLPLAPWLGERSFALKSRGGAVVKTK